MTYNKEQALSNDTIKSCKDCKRFRQHYIKFRKRYIEIPHGHCVHPRLKDRECDTPACNRYVQRK